MYTVIGAFNDRKAAQHTVDALLERGFASDRIDVQSQPGSAETSASTSSSTSASGQDEGFVGGVKHFFASLFGEERDSDIRVYSEAVRRGNAVVVVDADDEGEAERASQVMREQGGTIELDESEQQFTQQRERSSALDETRRGAGGRDEVVLPVVQEEVKVGKRAVERGGVRVVRRTSETPISELVRLREEHARIERRPVDRPASAADFGELRDESIEVRETAEEPVVEKVARVVEEVVVGREVNERTERVEDTVRRTDVEVDRLDEPARSTDETGRSKRGRADERRTRH